MNRNSIGFVAGSMRGFIPWEKIVGKKRAPLKKENAGHYEPRRANKHNIRRGGGLRPRVGVLRQISNVITLARHERLSS